MASWVAPEEVEEATQGVVASSAPGLGARIEQCVDQVRRYCGWHVFPVLGAVERLDGPGSALLQLPTLRLVDLTSLREDGKELDKGSLRWSARGMVEKSHGGFSTRLGSLEVQMSHGYEHCADVASVVLAIVARGACAPAPGRASLTVGGRSESFASVRGSFGTVAPFADELAVLARYRLPALSGFC